MSLVWSEDDVRTKVVYSWLREHGFSPQQIHVEFGFRIRSGRQFLSSPRTDALITDGSGRNLLVVEVKAPSVALTDADRDQAISYAGMVATGNQVPFVVLTNGSETRIYESATRRLLDGESISVNHRYAQSGYTISGDDLALLKDLVDLFVSLTPDNLQKFCSAQVDSRMRLLRGHELDGGKKYIPALYIERKAAAEELGKYLDDELRPVVFVIGKPQVGKTNFICHAVEQRLASGNPVLFFPAISMEDRLSNEIARDFGWLFNGAVIDSAECWTRLQRVVGKSGKKLQLFVDGWNEGTREVVRSIHRDYDLFQGHGVQLVVSLTSTSCMRLLRDEVGNIESLTEACGIPSVGAIELLEVDPKQAQGRKWSVVVCDSYTQQETEQAYSKYAEAFEVNVPETHAKTSDPYVLRIGMEFSRNRTLPVAFDESQLIRETIKRKADRVVGLERTAVVCSLTSLSDALLCNGGPLTEKQARAAIGLPDSNEIPCGMFDAALLARSQKNDLACGVDFYYGRERDYVISHLCRNWHEKLLDFKSLETELNGATDTNAGREALIWFMSQSQYLNKLLDPSDDVAVDPPVLEAMLSGLSKCYHLVDDETVREFAIWCTTRCDDPRVVFEAGTLFLDAVDDRDSLTESIEQYCQLDTWLERILTIGEIERESLSEMFLDALKMQHWDSLKDPYAELGQSDITSVLMSCARSASRKTRIGVSACYGHIDPLGFFESLKDLVELGCQMEELLVGLDCAESSLDDRYNDSIYGCPGLLYSLDTEEQLHGHFLQVYEHFEKAIKYFPYDKTDFTRDLFRRLTPKRVKSEGANIDDDTVFKHDPNNLLLPFKEDAEPNE